MKKFRLFAAIFTVLFLSSFITKELHAAPQISSGDKWKIMSAKGPSSLKLKSHSVGFKIKIKNDGDVKTSGENLTVKIKITFDGFTEYEEVVIKPPPVSPGKTTTLSVLCTNENFWTPHVTNTTGTKTISVNFGLLGLTTNLNNEISIKVK